MKLKSILLLGATALISGEALAQSHVSTSGTKYVLLEEGTGAWCGWCSDGAQIIEQTIEPTYPNAIIASFHNTTHPPYVVEDDMELAGDPFNTGTGYDAPGFPYGAIDRVPLTHPDPSTGLPVTQVGDNRGYWSSDMGTRLSTTPNFDVIMNCTYDPTTSKLVIQVTGKVLVAQTTGKWNVNAYLVEDSIYSGATGLYQQHSYMYTGYPASWFTGLCTGPCPGSSACASCALIPPASYSHMNVVEKVFATNTKTTPVGIWGDSMFTAPLTVGQVGIHVYTYTVPAKFIGDNGTAYGPGWTTNYKHLKVIGLIEKYGTTTSDRAIENAIVAKVSLMLTSNTALNASTVSAELQDVSIFPNPAANSINVKYTLSTPADTRIAIKNAVGQVVMEKTYRAGGTQFSENISLNNLSNGIYFMNIESNDGNTTKEFTVNK